ncbi:MAG: hypothetical protein J2P30_07395 [Actinobacteria bacterium]|nr:hypothetical protein [Actinomycetota bacterium]
MRLLVFLHGTVLMHSGAIGVTRAERVAQVRAGDPTVGDYAAYVPVGDAVAKLCQWQDAGARIGYLSSQCDPYDVALDAFVLRAHGFPAGRVLARQPGESYGDLAAHEAPDVLIEDDRESIGADQVTYPQIPKDLRTRIKSIVVPEFGGIDHLPGNPQALLTYRS